MLPPAPSLPVVMRKVGRQIEDVLLALGPGLAGNPAGIRMGSLLPDDRAYHEAVRRLEKKGVVAGIVPGKNAYLRLLPGPTLNCPPWLRPRREWSRRWRRVWYILTYDVPEKEANYRKNLKGFIERERFGQFQRSVWVTFRDVRPLIQDLIDGAALLDFAMIFEARTALGISDERIVDQAWNWPKIHAGQRWYLAAMEKVNGHLDRGEVPREGLPDLLQEEMVAYRTAMVSDPLLPKALLPPEYLGQVVFKVHEAFLARWQQLARA